jgi:hypothetical protein
MAFTEDLSGFFDTTLGFAVDATYNGATPVKVIFDEAYLGELGIASTNPTAVGKASDFPVSAKGKTLQIGATTYTISEAPQKLDDGALVRLQLQK